MASSFIIESGIQLLSRLNRKPDLQNFYPALFQNGPKSGEIIEIYTDTDIYCLLYDIICEALLSTCLEKDANNTGVLLFNCCGNFSYDTLLTYMRSKIKSIMKKKNMNINNEEIHNGIFRKILSNFLVVQVYDSVQLYTTIHNLESVFVEHPNITLIIFDNITAFYWSEQNLKITKMDIYLKKILQTIQQVTKECKTSILYTRPDYFSSSKESIENLEPCSLLPNLEKINYRIQVLYCKNSMFQVNIRTFQNIDKKMFFIDKDIIKWQ